MRKTEATLARILKIQIAYGTQDADANPDQNTAIGAFSYATVHTAVRIALDFADQPGINKTEFLAACGLSDS